MSVADVLEGAIDDGVTPGAAALVVVPQGPRLLVTAGTLDRGESAPLVSADTVYDLASLTKVLSTTLLTAWAVAEGQVELDEEPWPAWPGVTVAHVLAHESGLPAWQPLFEEAIAHRVVGLPAGRQRVVAACLEAAPEAGPGEATVYSDLGFIALGALLEDRLGDRLDRLFDEVARSFYGPSGLAFCALYEDGYLQPFARVAPTERCRWRGRVVQAQVHDDNAFAMGGVAGHAGLFGSVLDVERAALALLAAVHTGGEGVAGALQRFAHHPGARGLGFDRASPEGTTGGVLTSRTVGHLGFTGTSLWLDPDLVAGGAAFVLLTNRVHESREGEGIGELRRAFHRAAVAWLAQELPVDRR